MRVESYIKSNGKGKKKVRKMLPRIDKDQKKGKKEKKENRGTK